MTTEKNPFKQENILKAFFLVYGKLKERLPSTIWIFENHAFDSYVLCDTDSKYPNECIPAPNLWKTSCENKNSEHNSDNENLKEKREVNFVCVKKKDIRKLLKFLLVIKHLRVEIFRYTTSLFEKVMKASPSDLSDVNEILFGEDGEAEYSEVLGLGPIVSLQLVGDIKDPKIGMAFWHDKSKCMQLIQFSDNFNLDVVESMIIQYSPSECFIPGNMKWSNQVKNVMERNKVLCNEFQPKKSDLDKVEEDILRSAPSNKKHAYANHDIAVKAFASLKMQAKGTELEDMMKNVEILNSQEFIRFNYQADAGLHIFETGESYNAISLFKLLNKTRTAGGERLLQRWLKQPLTSKERICERLDIVEYFVENLNVRKTLHDSSLRKIPDFESIAIRICDKRAQLQDLYKAYLGVKEVRLLTKLLEDHETSLVHDYFTNALRKKIEKMVKYQELIETTVDLMAISRGVFMVNPSFDDELKVLSEKITETHSKFEISVNKISRYLQLDKKNVRLDKSQQFGFCYRVTLKDEKMLRNKDGIHVVDSAKAGVRFRNIELEQLNKDYIRYSDAYEKQQKYVLNEILICAAGYSPFLIDLGALCSKLDCLVSFAIASECAPIPYTKPIITDRENEELVLEDARHPTVETLNNMCFIANDAQFNKENRAFCIITGPNLGGKSTYLRTVALNVLMAQIGCFCACKSAKLFPVDRILVRIGAGDSQMTGVSTFMAEMQEASHIVRSATKNSLIIIDELGRGTSTYDGLGLAWAISHFIASEIQAFTLFATHFHEITKLSSELKNVFNCHVDAIANDDEFTLLYKVKSGGSSKSFGIEVAKLAGFPDDVIADAKMYLKQAEMPLLRMSKEDDKSFSEEISNFLNNWKDPTINQKRKEEMREEMRAKVARHSEV